MANPTLTKRLTIGGIEIDVPTSEVSLCPLYASDPVLVVTDMIAEEASSITDQDMDNLLL